MTPHLRSWLTSFAREAALFILFAAISVVMTWPLARLLPIAVTHPGDPLINTYILSWDVYALASDPSQLFHTNTLHPARYGLTFSENLLGLWPIAAILLPLTSPLTTHNVLLLLGFAFSAYGASVLARAITGSLASGVIAGVAYGFCTWRFVHLAHLQHAWGGWLPLIVAALLWYDRRRTWRAASLITLAFVLNGLTNLHYLVFSIPLVGIAAIALLAQSRDRRHWRYVSRFAIALLAGAIILAAILWPYRIAQDLYETRGDRAETTRYSASLSDWSGTSGSDEPERKVFPGLAAIALAVAGLLMLMRRSNDDVRIWGLIAVAWIAIAVAFSLGPEFHPYELLFERSPMIRGIRAPARWAVLAYLGVAVLGAIANRAQRAAVTAVVATLLLAQSFAAPIRWYLMPERVAPVYEWLRAAPPGGAILELPIGSRDVYYLPGATVHHRPTINGVSGGAAPIHNELRSTFGSSTIPDTARARLAELGTSLIVVHADALEEDADEVRRWLRDALLRGDLTYQGHFEDAIYGDYVFSLDDAGGKSPDATLRSFLDNDRMFPPNQLPFGYLEVPLPTDEPRGLLKVRGWALSGTGIRTVRLWFGNKACSVTAELLPYPGLQNMTTHHTTAAARFAADIERRPCGAADTDILVELIDHGGKTATLPHMFFRWE